MTTYLPDAEGAPRWPVFDGHVDMVYSLQKQVRPELAASPFALPCLADGGVRVITSSLYCADAYNGPNAVTHLAQLLTAEMRQLDRLPLILTGTDLDAAWHNIGPPGRLRLLENADALPGFGVNAACKAGIVAVGLTHAGRNRLADGNAVAAPGGLTSAGQRLLKELAAAGRVIDVAHLAAPGLRQVLELYPGPLASSHTGLRRFCDLPRNLDEAQLLALFRRDAMVGLAFAPELLATSGPVDLEEVYRQVDWLVQRFGAGQVGLGSDFGGYDGRCDGLEDHAKLPALAARLERAGYPDSAIAGIMGENWRRFYAAALPP